MKRLSIALRLALLTGLGGVLLVCIALGFVYWTLHQQLDVRAHNALLGRMTLIQHALRDEASADAIASHAQPLQDLLFGNDMLQLAITRPGDARPLATFGLLAGESVAHLPDATAEVVVTAWTHTPHRRLLSAVAEARTRNGDTVKIYLTRVRDADVALLRAVAGTIAEWMPAALLLIVVCAWFGVRRGLRPLAAFGGVADAVTTSDLTRRLEVNDLPDELRRPAAAFNTMLDRLDAGVTRLSQFSADLAHELRTPLANLLGKTQVILSQARGADEYLAALESNAEEFERMSRIATDMLFLAQVDHAQAALRREPVTLDAEAALVVEFFSSAAEEKAIAVHLAGAATVRADREMIQRAISNLLSNAIRHAPHGSAVELSIKSDERGVALSVSNAGAGIAPEHVGRIFERFYRADAGRSRDHGGTGLGLAIVRSIMQLHGGLVRVTSAQAGPTVFTLVFPLGAGSENIPV